MFKPLPEGLQFLGVLDENEGIIHISTVHIWSGGTVRKYLLFDGSHEEVGKKNSERGTHGHSVSLEVHAGHGITFDSVAQIAALEQVVELNIGHFLIGEAIFSGLDSAIRRMRSLMDKARAGASGRLSA